MPAPASLSLERKLPLLISVFLVSLAVGLTGAGYHEVKQASELRGIDRLQRLASQLAQLSNNSTEQRYVALRHVAADTNVVAYLAGSASDQARARLALGALRALAITPSDSSIVAELRSTSDAVRIGTVPELPGDVEPVSALIAKLSQGQVATGGLHFRGDSTFYFVGAPVTGNGRIVGYVIQRRTITSNPRTEQIIRDLAGTERVSIYVASDSSARWAGISGGSPFAPVVARRADDASNVMRFTRDGDEHTAVYARLANTPLRLIIELSDATLLERPSAFLRRSIVVAVVMLAIGIVAAWILSRRITRPLRELTVAADAISTGNYSHRAAVSRRDETGRLADAFNTMAEQVQRSHDDLERQIAESRMLATRLAEANRAKADFLATMSHELRTPLNAIAGYVELIELGVRGPVTEAQKRDLDRVRFNQRHLLALIGNILDFTRLDAQKLPFELEDVHVDRAVHEVLTGIAPLLDEKSLRTESLGCGAPVIARADRARLEQILLNLLSNAVRFTPQGGVITISVCERDRRVEVKVTDSGIGIPAEKLAAIFEPFVQVDSGLTRTVGGTGLGLTISRALARGMGGDLTADSDGSTGATFTLSIPAARTRDTAPTTDWSGSEMASVPVGASPIR
jgi:signal transduction histidine kinase